MFTEREPVTSSISQEISDIDLDGFPGNERVIIERITDITNTTYTTFIIQRFCPVSGNWYTQYIWTIEGLVYTEIENENWNILNAPVVILKVFARTGSFLTYRVVGYHFGALTNLVARDSIFQGNVFFDDFNIIEKIGNQYRIWQISHDELHLSPYRVPIISDAYVFEYFITGDSQILMEITELTLPVGGILQFIRRDFNPIPERLLFSTEEPEAVRIIQNRSAYQFRRPMNITFSIIPEAYNLENAANIYVKIT
ncbi:MAG: hypothetical protein GX213_05140 [Clostridiaceae bacterium]|nr:hypothetical protein [Clostridiaceae bacterium]